MAEHIRFERLQTVCDKALEESQKVLTDENLLSCFPSLNSSEKGKQLLNTIRLKLTESWSENTRKEFNSIFEERDIENKLNELDDLINDANKRDPDNSIPIEELSSINILNSYMIPVKKQNLNKLKEQVESLKLTNLELLKELKSQLNNAHDVKNQINENLQSIQSLNNLSDDLKLKENLEKLIEITKNDEEDI